MIHQLWQYFDKWAIFFDFKLSEWLNIDILMVFYWQIAYILMILKTVDILLIKDWWKIDFLLIFDKNVDFLFIFC